MDLLINVNPYFNKIKHLRTTTISLDHKAKPKVNNLEDALKLYDNDSHNKKYIDIRLRYAEFLYEYLYENTRADKITFEFIASMAEIRMSKLYYNVTYEDENVEKLLDIVDKYIQSPKN